MNPESLEEAFRQHEMVLDLAPPLLTISLLDCEAYPARVLAAVGRTRPMSACRTPDRSASSR